MAQDRKQFEETFALVGADPGAWLEQGRGMKIAAQPILQGFLGILNEPPSRPGVRLQKLAHVNAYMLLMGLAFENVLKAIAVKSGRLTVKSELTFRRPEPGKSGHSLTGLARILDLDPKLTTTEHEYLQRLEEFLWWAGRYPIPKKPGSYAESHATSRLSFKTTDPGLGEKLFDKLASLIEQSA